jgi:phage shock protein A
MDRERAETETSLRETQQALASAAREVQGVVANEARLERQLADALRRAGQLQEV